MRLVLGSPSKRKDLRPPTIYIPGGDQLHGPRSRRSSVAVPRSRIVRNRPDAAGGEAMSCCRRVTASTSDQISTIRPHSMRKMLMPVHVAMRPVGGRNKRIEICKGYRRHVDNSVVTYQTAELTLRVTRGLTQCSFHAQGKQKIDALYARGKCCKESDETTAHPHSTTQAPRLDDRTIVSPAATTGQHYATVERAPPCSDYADQPRRKGPQAKLSASGAA